MRRSSNYALRLPGSLKKAAEEVAREDGTTLNQFIVTAVAEKLASLKTAHYFSMRASNGVREAALTFLSRSGGAEPIEADRLE